MQETRGWIQSIDVDGTRYRMHSLAAATRAFGRAGLDRLPFSLRILAENVLRRGEPGDRVADLLGRLLRRERGFDVGFRPARVLLQDMLGVPVLVDLAALREAVARAGGDPQRVNPAIPSDLVVDHSIVADVAGVPDAAARNRGIEQARNRERFEFLAWCHQAFRNLRVVPPGRGILHQVNAEYLARIVWTQTDGDIVDAYPDTLVGTDSHTTMVNALGVLGWGVGGIEAEAAMLGRTLSLAVPEVVGVRVRGRLAPGVTSTDLVLYVTEALRRERVVGCFIEFFGPELDLLGAADRATIANMAPEYGATCVFFPVDRRTIDYLAATGRERATIALAEHYARAQGLWRDAETLSPQFDRTVDLDIGRAEACIAGPRRPHDRIALGAARAAFERELPGLRSGRPADEERRVPVEGTEHTFGDGDIALAAITSCTNTSNPAVVITAALVARRAIERGLRARPWVKTSFAPGSRAVSEYLERAGLMAPLEALGFHVVAYGCTTCNGSSGPLPAPLAQAITANRLVATAVLSGNRNFDGRIHPSVRAAYLASPPLVVAYALAGTLRIDLTQDSLGTDQSGHPVFLRDLWPADGEVAEAMAVIEPGMYRRSYAHVFEGDAAWASIARTGGTLFDWKPGSTYFRRPPYFDGLGAVPPPPADLRGMRPLAILGDFVATDHLAPNGAIPADSPAGRYLAAGGVAEADFNTYGARRSNFEIGIRSAAANARLQNRMVPGTEGGVTRLMPDGTVHSVFDAATTYLERAVPLVIVAGRDYGAGSSRDWAAKGVSLLGVKSVIAESFERIHRANLIGTGVLPVRLPEGTVVDALGLDGSECYDLTGIAGAVVPGQVLRLVIRHGDGRTRELDVTACIETPDEAECLRHGGILPMVYRELVAAL